MRPWGRMDKARAGEGWGGSGETWWGQNLSCGAQSVSPVLQGLCLWPKGFRRMEAISKPHSLVFGTTHCRLGKPTLKWSIVIGQYFRDVSAGGWRWRLSLVVVLAVSTGWMRGWWSCLVSRRRVLGRWRLETEFHVALWTLVSRRVRQLWMHDDFSLHLVPTEGIQPLHMPALQRQHITRKQTSNKALQMGLYFLSIPNMVLVIFL